jgi:recombinase
VKSLPSASKEAASHRVSASRAASVSDWGEAERLSSRPIRVKQIVANCGNTFVSNHTTFPMDAIIGDPERAPFIARAFEELATGRFTKQEVIARMTEAGLRTRRGLVLSPQSFGQIVRNSIYVGRVSGGLREKRERRRVRWLASRSLSASEGPPTRRFATTPADSLREKRERRLVSRVGIEPTTRRLRVASGKRKRQKF